MRGQTDSAAIPERDAAHVDAHANPGAVIDLQTDAVSDSRSARSFGSDAGGMTAGEPGSRFDLGEVRRP